MFFQVRFEIQEASFWLLERGALLLTVCELLSIDICFVLRVLDDVGSAGGSGGRW